MITALPLRKCVAAGGWVAVSGQVGLADGALIDGGVASQTRHALLNFEAVLAAHDLTMADVVKTTVFLTKMDDFAEMNGEYEKAFDQETASSVHGRSLSTSGRRLVEIEGWAHAPPGCAREFGRMTE